MKQYVVMFTKQFSVTIDAEDADSLRKAIDALSEQEIEHLSGSPRNFDWEGWPAHPYPLRMSTYQVQDGQLQETEES